MEYTEEEDARHLLIPEDLPEELEGRCCTVDQLMDDVGFGSWNLIGMSVTPFSKLDLYCAGHYSSDNESSDELAKK